MQGSVSLSMTLFQSRLCFVCFHLTSWQKDGAEQRRNADVCKIIRRACFSSVFDAEQPQTISSHDKIFWFGDLNNRLNMSEEEIRKLVALKRWDKLISNDQLSKVLGIRHVFDGWREGVIDFPPTYKYENNSDRYVGDTPKEGEKQRSPAWCDQLLWLGKGIKQLCYKRAEIKISDHRSVYEYIGGLNRFLLVAFKLYDLRQTGYIEREELEEMVFALLGESDLDLDKDLVRSIVDNTMMEADSKGDGKIDEEEWKEFVSKNPAILKNMTLPYLKEVTLAFPSFVLNSEVED